MAALSRSLHAQCARLCWKAQSTDGRGGSANAFDQTTRDAAKAQWQKLTEAFDKPADRLAKLKREAEDDVLAFLGFSRDHRSRLDSTSPLEQLNKEVKRRTHVVGIFPNEAAILRLVGALMFEQTDEWGVMRRYMSLETVSQVCEDQTIDVAKIAAF